MELLISLITNNESRSQSIVELTQNKYFQRHWSSIYNGVESYYCKRNEEASNRSQLRKKERKKISTYLLKKLITPGQKRNLILIDTTPNSKKHSAKALDRTYIRNGGISEPGYEYSVVCIANQPKWAVPVSIERVESNNNKYQQGSRQILDVANQTSDETLHIAVGDSSYSANSFICPLYQSKNVVTITRQRVNRAMYDVFQGPQKAKGRKRIYGKKMIIKDIDESVVADHSEVFTEDSKKGVITIKISEYRDKIVRNSKDYTMNDKKLNFIKIEVFDHNGKKKYKRDLWLCVSGESKNQLSAKEVYLYYKQRFDIEHFFKFGKTKLLMGKFQTNNPNKDEDYMLFVMLAYNMLYHAREDIQDIKFRPWDNNKLVNKDNLSPSQVYRSISHIAFDNIVNPPKNRGIPTEANIRKNHNTKENSPVVRKQEVQDKIEISIKSTLGNNIKYSQTSINRQLSSMDDVIQCKDLILEKIGAMVDGFSVQLE